jgi:hypothetical protein
MTFADDRSKTSGPATSGREQAAVALFFLLAWLALIAPALVNVYPLSADYMNHLSRIAIGGSGDEFFQKIFETRFEIVPNLALDLFALAVKPLALGPDAVVKSFFVLSSLLVWIGAAAFYRAAHGALRLPAILAIPVCYSFLTAYGFFNFSFGAGLFLIAFAWLVRARPGPGLSICVLNLAGALLFFSHFGALLVMIASIALYRIGDGTPWRRAGALSAAESVLPFGLYLLRVPNGFSSLYFTGLPLKLWAVISAFLVSGAATAFLSALLFAVPIGLLLRARAIRLPARWRPLIVGLAVLGLVAPFGLQASFFTDWRLIWTALLLALLTVEVDLDAPWAKAAVVGVVAGILLVNVETLFRQTAAFNRSAAEFKQAIEVIPPHSFVFASSYERATCPAGAGGQDDGDDVDFIYDHAMPALVSVTRASVYPFIFAHRGAEATFFRPAFAEYFSETPRGPVDSLIAAFFVTGGSIPLDWNGAGRVDGSVLGDMPMAVSSLMQGWSRRFSYVIHLAKNCPERGPYAGMFPEVARGSFFTIYRVAAKAGE